MFRVVVVSESETVTSIVRGAISLRTVTADSSVDVIPIARHPFEHKVPKAPLACNVELSSGYHHHCPLYLRKHKEAL